MQTMELLNLPYILNLTAILAACEPALKGSLEGQLASAIRGNVRPLFAIGEAPLGSGLSVGSKFQTVLEGDDTSLNCSFSPSNDQAELRWGRMSPYPQCGLSFIHNFATSASSPTIVPTYVNCVSTQNRRYKLVRSTVKLDETRLQVTLTVEIANLQHSDEGPYVCTVSNSTKVNGTFVSSFLRVLKKNTEVDLTAVDTDQESALSVVLDRLRANK